MTMTLREALAVAKDRATSWTELDPELGVAIAWRTISKDRRIRLAPQDWFHEAMDDAGCYGSPELMQAIVAIITRHLDILEHPRWRKSTRWEALKDDFTSLLADAKDALEDLTP